jgi:hypothetical protein
MHQCISRLLSSVDGSSVAPPTTAFSPLGDASLLGCAESCLVHPPFLLDLRWHCSATPCLHLETLVFQHQDSLCHALCRYGQSAPGAPALGSSWVSRPGALVLGVLTYLHRRRLGHSYGHSQVSSSDGMVTGSVVRPSMRGAATILCLLGNTVNLRAFGSGGLQ